MDRFTQRAENGNVFYPYCFERCNGMAETEQCINCEYYDRLLKKFADYEDAEEQGLMLRLPCKIGDVAWAIRHYRGATYAQKGFVNEMFFTKEIKLCIVVKNIARGEFGKTVFLTKEEAEQALEKMKGV